MRHGISAKYITAGVGGQANFADSMLNQTSKLFGHESGKGLTPRQVMRNSSERLRVMLMEMQSPEERRSKRSRRQRLKKRMCQWICSHTLHVIDIMHSTILYTAHLRHSSTLLTLASILLLVFGWSSTPFGCCSIDHSLPFDVSAILQQLLGPYPDVIILDRLGWFQLCPINLFKGVPLDRSNSARFWILLFHTSFYS